MKKKLGIGLAIAATLGVGIAIYQKFRTAPADTEIIASPDLAPAPGRDEASMETPPALPDPEHPEPASGLEPKARAKAASGHFEMSRPGSAQDDVGADDSPGYGRAREKRLWDIFKRDKDLARSVQVNSIHCRVDTCIVEAESKDGDADRFQSLLLALTKQYPWIGNKIDVTTPDGNPLKGRFVYFHEIPK